MVLISTCDEIWNRWKNETNRIGGKTFHGEEKQTTITQKRAFWTNCSFCWWTFFCSLNVIRGMYQSRISMFRWCIEQWTHSMLTWDKRDYAFSIPSFTYWKKKMFFFSTLSTSTLGLYVTFVSFWNFYDDKLRVDLDVWHATRRLWIAFIYIIVSYRQATKSNRNIFALLL